MPHKSRYHIESAEIANRELRIRWGDHHHSNYHPVWLRHQCQCEICGSPMDAVRGIRIHHIPDNIEPAELVFGDNGVTVVWSNDRHKSHYSAQWLRDHCYADNERDRRKHRPILWDASIAENAPTVDFTAIEKSASARLAMLETVVDRGFCKVINMPTEADQAHRAVELVGPQRLTHFGTYKLAKKTTVRNVGDVTDALDPHNDETYRMSTIGITVFQVLRPSSNGGASTLVDGFEAVRRLRESHPADFELLCSTPITSHRFDQFSDEALPKWYMSRQPVIKLDDDGEVCGVRINERQMAPLDAPAAKIDACYRALRRLMNIVYDEQLRLTFDLRAGGGLIFNNQRVLHGRTAYVAEQPGRSVLTSSVDLEEFYSTLRVLKMQQDDREPPKKYAQGMVF